MVWDDVQRGLALRVQPTGVKSFKVAYYHQGKLRWYTIDRYGAIGLKEAREVARVIRAKAALGQDPQGDKMQERIGETLVDLHERYLEKKAHESKSWRQADKLMKRYVLPTLGKRKIKDVTSQDMWKLFDDLSKRPVLANCVMASVSAMFNWAVKRHIVTDNPCRGIEHNKTGRSKRFLSNDEVRLVWPLFDDLGLFKTTILKLILLTGQRPGEVTSMRWEHLDLDANLWSMPGAPTIGWRGTKNGRDHEVPLTDPMLELLREFDPERSGHVFPSTWRGKCIKIPSTQSVWAAAGIPRFRPHDLRATAATKLDELGVSQDHIGLILNHVQTSVTASYIRHDQRKHKRAALELWADELMAILRGRLSPS